MLLLFLIMVITQLIKTNKIDDYEYTKKLIEELDFEKISITKIMLDELTKILNENNDYIKKYIIKEIKDFNKDIIINFYYILFKYILKLPFYINYFQFLLNTKKIFIKLIKSDTFNYEDIKKEEKEKFLDIFNFFTDNQYYNKKYLNTKKKSNKNKNNNNKISIGVSKTTRPELDETYFSIIKFVKKICEYNYRKYYTPFTPFIKEMNNGNVIINGPKENTLYICDKNLTLSQKNLIDNTKEQEIKIKSTNSESTKNESVRTEFIRTKTEFIITKNIIEANGSNVDDIKILNCSNKIITTLENRDENNKKNYWSENSLTLYSKKNGSELEEKKYFNFPCTGCFEIINEGNNTQYIIVGEKGIQHFEDIPSNNVNPTFVDDNLPYKGGIKINNNYLALTSNSIIPNGKNILVFYDIKNKKIIKPNIKDEYSFNIGVNGLTLMKIENKDVLLCACKKYTSQNNGILIIEPEIKEDGDISLYFHDTEAFEVNCFCPINIKNNGIFNQTNYLFVGGLDCEKKEGMIKLYKITKNQDKSKMYDAQYLQDIVIDINDDFRGFNGTINCIIQSKINGNIFVSCWDGNVYCFSEPNISYYMKKEDIFNDSKNISNNNLKK